MYRMRANTYVCFQDGFAPPEELEGDGLAPDDEEEY